MYEQHLKEYLSLLRISSVQGGGEPTVGKSRLAGILVRKVSTSLFRHYTSLEYKRVIRVEITDAQSLNVSRDIFVIFVYSSIWRVTRISHKQQLQACMCCYSVRVHSASGSRILIKTTYYIDVHARTHITCVSTRPSASTHNLPLITHSHTNIAATECNP